MLAQQLTAMLRLLLPRGLVALSCFSLLLPMMAVGAFDFNLAMLERREPHISFTGG